MKVKKVKKSEFIDWINKQPDEKSVNFIQWHPEDHNISDFCGCVMYQYGQEVLSFEPMTTSGMSDWYLNNRDTILAVLVDDGDNRITIWSALSIDCKVACNDVKTYKDLKDHLASYGR